MSKEDTLAPGGLTIVVDLYHGTPRFAPHFDGYDGPAPMHFDHLPTLVEEARRWGCCPIRYSPEALELHRQDEEALRTGKVSPLYPNISPEEFAAFKEDIARVGLVEAALLRFKPRN